MFSVDPGWVTNNDMHTTKRINTYQCQHSLLPEASGLVLITIGGSLKGIGSALCNCLSASVKRDICRFDLDASTGGLDQCLAGHSAAIIIDCTQNGTTSGTISIMDLAAMLDRATIINVGSCHGFSLADELRIAKNRGTLPKRLIFFGVEVSATVENDQLNSKLEEKLPQLVKNLSLLIDKVLEILKRNGL